MGFPNVLFYRKKHKETSIPRRSTAAVTQDAVMCISYPRRRQERYPISKVEIRKFVLKARFWYVHHQLTNIYIVIKSGYIIDYI